LYLAAKKKRKDGGAASTPPDEDDTASSSSSSSKSPKKKSTRRKSVSSTDVSPDLRNTTTATDDTDNDDAAHLNNVTQAVVKKIRVAKAQAEIDRILLSRVTSIAPPVPVSAANLQADADVAQQEEALYQAVKQQDYGQAATLQTAMQQAHVDDCGAVLQANAAFYRAFSQKDYAAMEDLWCPDNTATCVHPASRQPLVGAKAVLASWKHLLEARQPGTTFQSTCIRDVLSGVKNANPPSSISF
jgi:hypothetical protein